MANTSFRIGRDTVIAEPAEPPIYTWPTVPNSPIVQYPRPAKRDGYGRPAGIIGKPWVEMGRSRITQQGLTWWNALFTSATAEYQAVKVKLYDQRSASWKIYSGTLWRPMCNKAIPGHALTYADFMVTVTDLVELAGWS